MKCLEHLQWTVKLVQDPTPGLAASGSYAAGNGDLFPKTLMPDPSLDNQDLMVLMLRGMNAQD